MLCEGGDGAALLLRCLCTLSASLGLLLFLRGGPRLGLALCALSVAAIIAAPNARASPQLFDGRAWSLLARIDGVPRSDGDSLSVPISLRAAGERLPDRAAVGRLRLRVGTPPEPLGPGDLVLVRARALLPGARCNFGACDGAWRAAADGVDGSALVADPRLVVRAAVPASGLSARLWALRCAMRAAIDSVLPPEEAALVAALVVGERGAVTPEEEVRFRAAGVTHLLSVSGLHLAFAAGLLFGLARCLLRWLAPALGRRRPRDRWAAALALPVAAAYALLTGAEVATVRATLIVGYAFVGLVLARRVRAKDALAFAALGILIARPASLLDPSFQLSFVAALAMLARPPSLAAPKDDAPPPLHARMWRWAVRLCTASFAATLATAPITAYHFFQIAPMGVVSNLAAIPLTEMAIVPIGLVGALLRAGGFAIGGPVLVLAGFLASVLIALVHVLAAWAPVLEVAAPSALVLCVSALGLCWIARAPRSRVRRLLVSSAAVAGCVLLELTWAGVRPCVELTFLDVGQGDAAIARLPGGSAIIVDGGGGGRSDPGAQILVPALRRLGVRRIELVVLSHPHPDHAGGLSEVLRQFPVEELWWNGQPGTDPTVQRLLLVAAARKVPLGVPRTRRFGAVTLDVLAPRAVDGTLSFDPLVSENDNSLVLRLRYAGRSVLFAGDLEADGERALAAEAPGLIDVLKVPHHGSRTSSTDELLAATRPRWAVASLAAGNRYRFPHPDVLARYRAYRTRLFRTDLDGAVRIVIGQHGELTARCARPAGCATP